MYAKEHLFLRSTATRASRAVARRSRHANKLARAWRSTAPANAPSQKAPSASNVGIVVFANSSTCRWECLSRSERSIARLLRAAPRWVPATPALESKAARASHSRARSMSSLCPQKSARATGMAAAEASAHRITARRAANLSRAESAAPGGSGGRETCPSTRLSSSKLSSFRLDSSPVVSPEYRASREDPAAIAFDRVRVRFVLG
mmetsp:Transcript_1800/g.7444  ORF Transcript_1800/g.7444 Transcript_1800/m.7444 type:complete len:205 (+) Transcript_1800:976-1590(+)